MKNLSVYKAHCKTFKIAKRISGYDDVSPMYYAHRPLFRIRLSSAHRSEATKDFRTFVAKEVRRLRKEKLAI